MLKLLKSLFGGGSQATDSNSRAPASAAESVEYEQFSIRPEPIKEGSQFRTAGTITFTPDGEGGETHSVKFIRADNHASRDAAIEHAISKGKQIIDERGDSLLQSERC